MHQNGRRIVPKRYLPRCGTQGGVRLLPQCYRGRTLKTIKGPLKRWKCFNGLSLLCIELFVVVWCRRFLTLPQPPGCSTISVSRLSFRVRNGYRAFPCCYRPPTNTQGNVWLLVLCQILCSGREHGSDYCLSCFVVNTPSFWVCVFVLVY